VHQQKVDPIDAEVLQALIDRAREISGMEIFV